MQLLYCGFDGLDVSFKVQIDQALSRALEQAKEEAQKFRRDEYLEWGGIRMLVRESGARGGYAFSARTDDPEADWFFKKPNRHDPWGIRISCSSFQLASCGFAVTKAALISALGKLGIHVSVGSESIGRFDYAMDFLAPDLTIEPDHFVMHSNCSRADHHAEIEMLTQGKSGRVTSVTVGKMPGRQIIVYDKRAETLAKRKLWWHTIWNASRERQEMAPLDYSDPTKSRIWRVEVRAGKKHLKDTWGIRTWENLNEKVGDVIARSLEVVRYTRPIHDRNRSRWPDHALWREVQRTIADDLLCMRNFAEPTKLKNVQFEAYDQLLMSQIIGLHIARAGLHRIPNTQLIDFIVEHTFELSRHIAANASAIEPRLARATDRLRILKPYLSPNCGDDA